ncbi:MAG: TonB-dependent receptor [Acidobacteriota bacterium]|nr:TonB-dependent receptor [Acidobacteriota bacterium]
MIVSLRRLVLPVLLAAGFGVAALAAGDSGVHGKIVDASGLALPGVTVELVPRPSGTPLTAVTDETGTYTIHAPAGRYDLRAALAGFQGYSRADVLVGSPPLEVDVTLQLAALNTEVTVVAEPHALVSSPGVDRPAIVTRKLFDNALLWNNVYTDALPLLPNVVRAPDGQISVAGARTEQGGLRMNGFNESDPLNGEPSTIIPLESVGSIQVYSGFYPADLGDASGGVTTVDTRPGSDLFQFSTIGFVPRMRFSGSGFLGGVESWEPSVGLRGPIVKGKAWFAESLDYQYNENQFETAAGTQFNLFTSLTTMSQLDLQPTARHHLSFSFLSDPQTTDYAGVTQFTPLATNPQLHQGGWSGTAADRLTFGGSTTLESRFAVIHTDDSVVPHGTDPYVVGHDVTTGSYFDTQSDTADRVETGATLSRLVSAGRQQHLLKAGATVSYATTTGRDQGAPVSFLRSDGTLGQTISFPDAAVLAASTWEADAFLQDSWTPINPLTVDLGLRYDRSSAAVSGVVEPRLGWTLKLPGGASTLSGGFGVFADKVVLQALTFGQLPARLVQLYTVQGTADGPARLDQNTVSGPMRIPRARSWSLEFDHDFHGGWLTRVKYEDRQGTDEPVVTPEILSATAGVLALGSTGRSHAWSVETTVGYRSLGNGNEWYVSYVRSSTTGDLNDLNTIDGLFKVPLVQPDAIGPLAVDTPNRLLTWGLLQLPLQLSLSPFVEVRSGFPYTAIDDQWNVVGLQNGQRYAPFASLNLALYKVVRVSRRLPAARLGLQVFNLVSANNARDIQTDVANAAYGTTYNPAPRSFDGFFELLWGRH